MVIFSLAVPFCPSLERLSRVQASMGGNGRAPGNPVVADVPGIVSTDPRDRTAEFFFQVRQLTATQEQASAASASSSSSSLHFGRSGGGSDSWDFSDGLEQRRISGSSAAIGSTGPSSPSSSTSSSTAFPASASEAEFQSNLLEPLKPRTLMSSAPPSVSSASSAASAEAPGYQSQFTQASAHISKGLYRCSEKLQALRELVGQRNLFNDPVCHRHSPPWCFLQRYARGCILDTLPCACISTDCCPIPSILFSPHLTPARRLPGSTCSCR